MKVKVTADAVIRLDKIIRATRTEIEETAKRLVADEGRTEVLKDDIEAAAIVVFESSYEPLLNPRKS